MKTVKPAYNFNEQSVNSTFEIGVVLLITSTQISSILKYITGVYLSWLTPLLLILSLVLLFNFKNFIYTFRASFNFYVIMFLLCFLMISAIASSNFLLEYSGVDQLILAVIILFAFYSNSQKFNLHKFINTLFIFSFTSILVFIIFTTNFFTNFNVNINYIMDDFGNVLTDKIAISTISIYCIISAICKINGKNLFLYIFPIILSMSLILICNRRASIIYLFLVFILSFILNKENRREVVFLFISLLVISIIIFNKAFTELINSSIEAIKSMLFGGEDASGNIRNNLREEALQILLNFSIVNCFFGKGYMYRYLDFPLLQIIIDQGFIVGLLYMFLFLFYQLRVVFKCIQLKSGEYFIFVILGMINTFNLFYQGTPYVFTRFAMLILFIYFYEHNLKVCQLQSRRAISENIIY